MAEVLDPSQIASEAQSAHRAGDYLQAANMFRAAEEGFRMVGDELSAAEMANNQSVCLLQAGEPLKALEILEGKEQIFEQAGDIRRQAMTCGNRAETLVALRRYAEADINYQKAAALFRQIGERELYTATMQSLSALQMRTGRSLEALATMQAGMDKIERPNFKERVVKRILALPFRLLNR